MKAESHITLSFLGFSVARKAQVEVSGPLTSILSRLAEADRVDQEAGKPHDFKRTRAAQS
jgi:hypothetical protein